MFVYPIETIAKLLAAEAVNGVSANLQIDKVSARSASCSSGTLFVAVPGVKADGHDFIEDACSRGASCLVVSKASKLNGRPGLLVPDTRRALSLLAALFAGNPSASMTCIGVTGTNGKTTIHWILFYLLELLGRRPLRIGTLGAYSQGIIDRNEGLTTPDPVSVQQDIGFAKAHGADCIVMETSSHALDQHRVSDVHFDVGVFTNLTRDHLDYHGDMDSYFQAKLGLFTIIALNGKPVKAAVINIDCPYGRTIPEYENFQVLTYGTSPEAAIRVSDLTISSDASTFRLSFKGQSKIVHLSFIGRHNALNIAAAVGACIAIGHSFADIVEALPGVPQVPGRLEHISAQGLDIFVDYAHTPDALENTLMALREVTKERLWVVFGCGGDRDRGKRPQMAEIAARLADEVAVTSDNPRTEDPEKIIADILSSGVKPTLVDADRSKAIHEVIRRAGQGDVVLIAGKGHEDYQIIGTVKRHFSDVEEVADALERRA